MPTMTMLRPSVVLIALWLGSLLTLGASQSCERLRASLTYKQEEAPRDLSDILRVVVKKVNEVLEGVVDVDIVWTGKELHGRVGEHVVETKVTRLASAAHVQESYTDEMGRQVSTQCYHVPFTILDTNECTLPVNHPMRHQCHDSSICVNTNGSYECMCPHSEVGIPSTADETFWKDIASLQRTPWELSYSSSSMSSCPSSASTHGCCPELAHTKHGSNSSCRARFRCPVDPCVAEHDCTSSAQCVRASSPSDRPNFTCQCPQGLMGNGHKCRPSDPKPTPKVEYDGVTPTQETIKNNYYCDCTTPTVDACSGFPPCQGKHEVCTITSGNQPQCLCKPGFIKHEKYGCVDERPPTMRLKHDVHGDGITRLKQGDTYKEFAVEILDENAEEYMRSLKMRYSAPIPSGCLTKVGEFHVNYTLDTPWTTPSFVRETRRVLIEDIDECSLNVADYAKRCPSLVPQCDVEAGASCVNTVGSYKCQCPAHTTGDGFKRGASFISDVAEGFHGGTSCTDTSKPVIELVGPNPRIFRVCECGGIRGLSKKQSNDKDLDLKSRQQETYENDIKDLIRSTSGAELCATPSRPSPRSADCVKAFDQTYKGKVDLSDHVVVGEPVSKGPLRWSVPYDVIDQAGNRAETVWRDVLVEEVDAAELEAIVRKEAMQEQSRAVQRALEEDRKKRAPTSSRRSSGKDCPACPKCDRSDAMDIARCESVCKAKMESCAIDEFSFVIRMLLIVERYVPPSMVSLAILGIAVVTFIVAVRFTVAIVMGSESYQQDYYVQEQHRIAAINAPIHYYNNDSTPSSGARSGIPRHSMSVGDTSESIFSPRNPMMSPPGSDPRRARDDVYETEKIITPSSKRGNGARRRSPFSNQDGY